MKTRTSPLLIIAAFTTLACAPPGSDFSVPDRTAITQASNQYLDALTQGDVETYAQLFAANAQQLTGAGEMLDGRSEIRSNAEQMAAMIMESETSNILVGGSGDLAYRWMDYTITTSGATQDTAAAQADSTAMTSSTLEGRLLSVYERQDDGTWLIVADTWSGAAAQPASSMATEAASP